VVSCGAGFGAVLHGGSGRHARDWRGCAVAYWAEFPDEIDDLISRHRTSQDKALAAWERRPALDDA